MSSLALATETDSPAPSVVGMDGGMQFWAGLCYGCASLVNYMVLSGRVHLPNPAIIGMVWMAASAGFILFGLVLRIGSDRVMIRHPAVRRFRALWGTLILGAMVLVGTVIILMSRFDMAAQSSFVVSPIAMAIYGIGWRMAALTSGRTWPNLLSAGCFLSAPYLASLAGTPEQSLVYAICQATFALLPGLFLLMRWVEV